MKNTESALIEILKAFALNNSQEKLNIDTVDRDELFALAKAHSVIGIVYYILNKNNLFLSEDEKNKFMHEYDCTVMNMLSRDTSAQILVEKLKAQGIKHILFKGSVIASAYPVSALRTYGDVDILIAKEDVDRLCKFMISEGYHHSVADEGVVNVFVRNREHYEFHTNLNVSNVKKSDYFSDFWASAIVHEEGSFIFDHNFHLSYLICHLEKHVYGSGAGLRMYLDIVLYLRKYREFLDLDKIRDVLTDCGLGNFLNTVLFVCHKWFDLSLPEWVVPMADDVYESMCRFTLDGGVFGDTSEKQQAENSLRRNMESGEKNARFKFLFRRVFPPFSELSRLYPKYQGKRYLVFFAWIRHIFSVIRKKDLGSVKVLASASIENAKKKKDFLESIGSVR